MSTISDAFKNKEPVYIIELTFGGLKKRIATRSVQVGNYSFDGIINKNAEYGGIFNFGNMNFSINSPTIEILNQDRWQDLEASGAIYDGGVGKVYMWSEGLSWSDIETDGLIYKGTFYKVYNTETEYVFQLIDDMQLKFQTLPPKTIDDETWSGHRENVTGQCVPIVLGTFTKGVPMPCVDTSDYTYAVHYGVGDGSSQTVKDKDGDTISSSLYSAGITIDDEKNATSVFAFTGTQVDSEPLSCSYIGQLDSTGVYTTAGDPISHPLHIVRYIVDQYSANTIDKVSFSTAENTTSSYRFAAYINKRTDGIKFINRILKQCLAVMVQKRGNCGVVVFDLNGVSVAKINSEYDVIDGTVYISKTPLSECRNNIKTQYMRNPSTGSYEAITAEAVTETAALTLSKQRYGVQPEYSLDLPDVWSPSTAILLYRQFVTLYAFRHDIVKMQVPAHAGFDIEIGDIAELTIPEAPGGWTDEKCILIEKKYSGGRIKQSWWRIAH